MHYGRLSQAERELIGRLGVDGGNRQQLASQYGVSSAYVSILTTRERQRRAAFTVDDRHHAEDYIAPVPRRPPPLLPNVVPGLTRAMLMGGRTRNRRMVAT